MSRLPQKTDVYALQGLQSAVERWRKEVKCNTSNSFAKILGIAPQTAAARVKTPGKFCLDELKTMDKIEKLCPKDIAAILTYIGISEKRIREFARTYITQ